MTARTIDLYLDAYDRHTRLGPGLIATIPFSVTIAILGLRELAPVSITAAILTSAGGPALFADVVRDLGVRAQKHLYEQWGGMPTTNLLRLRNGSVNVTKQTKWRSAVTQLTGQSLANAKSEARSPKLADDKIESAVDDVRDKLRDKSKFPLLHHELRSYGYRRNMYGIRGPAITLAVVCGLAATLVYMRTDVLSLQIMLAALAIDIVAVVFWIAIVTDRWVKAGAERYAYQLFQAAVGQSKNRI